MKTSHMNSEPVDADTNDIFERKHRQPGGGRKPIGEQAMTRRTISLPESAANVLTALGAGNLSAGIRQMYKEHTMDRTEEVNQIRQFASDLYSNATCTAREYVALNPEQDAASYAQALIDTDTPTDLDEHDMRLLRRVLTQMAEADL